MKKEERIVILLAKHFLNSDEKIELNDLLSEYLDWAEVLGHLSIHRVMGIAWNTLQKYHLDIPKRIRSYEKLLVTLKEYNKLLEVKLDEQVKNLIPVCDRISKEKIQYASLKGIALNYFAYGMKIPRDFIDNDILISIMNTKEIRSITESFGYKHGNKDFKFENIEEVSRKDIMLRSMKTHELYPYIKKIPDSFIDYHFIDYQFSLDLFSSQRSYDFVDDMLNNAVKIEIGKESIYSLDLEDTFIFTLHHFYKEAISERKVLSYKDVALYKVCDILFLLKNENLNINRLISRIKKMQLEKSIYYSLKYCEELFNEDVKHIVSRISIENEDYLYEIYSDDYSRVTTYDRPLSKKVFDYTRASSLQNKISKGSFKIENR
ncbi:hypothetical protein ABID30_000751 [Enterococcus rotai]|uniref:Nucleotidyltransferase n=1 Tax=Enterococcus rotai TaxID=118060 RepID=A0A0U2WR86_9ENTE|nr:nucleotidyltransferase family protein [Enterococcus rotai]ALS36073.1 hypothetical protein ATZ35_02520 [Enterococcus rotai]